MDSARLMLLDGFVLDLDTQPVAVPRTLQRLLAFLGLRKLATRAHTVGALWPDSDECKAFGRLRTVLWRLQRTGAPIVATRGGSLFLYDWVQVDVNEFIHDLRTGGGGTHYDGQHELLPGWYDDWVLVERERLRQLHLHAMEQLAADHLGAARYAEAVEAALAAMRAEPLRETPHRLLLEIHIAEGNYSEAFNTYRAYQAVARRELGVEPSPGMQELLGLMVRSDPTQLPAVPQSHR